MFCTTFVGTGGAVHVIGPGKDLEASALIRSPDGLPRRAAAALRSVVH
jgi:hypothetical protein